MADFTRSGVLPGMSGSTENHASPYAPHEAAREQLPASGGRTSNITVVVCVYDMARLREIDLCLASLRRQTLAPAEVVVVVDGCEPLAAALMDRYRDITLVPLPENQGLSAARNAGLARVHTPWVAFLDDDAYAEPDWLAQLAEAHADTGAVGVGGWVEPVFVEGRPRWFPSELLWTVGCSHAGLPTERTVVRNVFGGCAMMATDALKDHGGYDESVGRKGDDARGGEEADLCLRIREAVPDAQFVLEPSAVIHHHVPGNRSRVGYVMKRCHADGKAKAGMATRLGADSLTSETAFVRDFVPRVLGLVARARVAAAFVLLLGMTVAAFGFAMGLLAMRLRPAKPALRRPGRPAAAAAPDAEARTHGSAHASTSPPTRSADPAYSAS